MIRSVIFGAIGRGVFDAQGILRVDSGGTDLRLGTSVALSASGDVCAAGAPLTTTSSAPGTGSVKVFRRTAGVWSPVFDTIVPVSGLDGDEFGCSVSLSSDGTRCAVGAQSADPGALYQSGRAFVYVWSPGSSAWLQESELVTTTPDTANYFGASVALSANGATCVVGAANADYVEVFVRTASTWSQQQRFTGVGTVSGDRFGHAVAVSSDGNTCAVGAYLDYTAGDVRTGAVYVFTRTGSLWSQQQVLVPTDAAATDFFGYSVSMAGDGNTLVVGSYLSDNGGSAGANRGAAYVFTRSGGVWSQQAKLIAPDASNGDQFGRAVAMAADGLTCVVGAFSDDFGSTANAGSTYVFTRSGSAWAQVDRIQAPDAAADDFFGSAVALSASGRTCVVGAPNDDNTSGPNAGTAYAYIW